MKVNTDTSMFLSAEDYAALQMALKKHGDSAAYTALNGHYQVASRTKDVAEKLLSVKLFQETLDSLLEGGTTAVSAPINRIQSGLQDYVARLSATVDMLTGVATPVPNIMHFVWVGGSEVGAIQRDYMNIWRTVLEPEGYRFNLWYDSDALLAFEMNRVILDSVRADAMASGGAEVARPSELAQMIEDRARVLKHQMFEYLELAQWRGKADEARIDLMVRAYGKDRAALEAFRQRCLETHQAMVGPDLQLRDARQEFAGHFLQDVYQREVAMRGNFAAASDVVRLQAEYLEGGRYSDMDYLPPLAEKLGGVDISGFDEDERIATLKLMLDHNEALMPGRDPTRYAMIGEVPSRHKEALTAFARSKPAAREIFIAPPLTRVPQDGIRLGTALSDPQRGEMNAHMLGHSGSGMTRSIMEVIRFNYDCLAEVERRMVAAGADWGEKDRLWSIIDDVLGEKTVQGIALAHADDRYMVLLDLAIRQYYSDGIRPEARGTIVLTGPSAASAGLGQYTDRHLLLDQWPAIRSELKLTEGYNVFTEEEQLSGWTVNGTEEDWFNRELEKWQAGKLKSRYAGDLNDLLKEQTLTFKKGWPVIEGKPVLLTSVLQQLMDDLGEPFIRAMKDKLSGDITFTTAFSIGVDSREQIRAQSVSALPPSVGAESTSNLNELFTRVAHGSLGVEHLSPLLRVMLGGVFGATTLDTDGFAGVWQNVANIARETADSGVFTRYNAIARAVQQRHSGAFKSALAGQAVSGAHSARELKVLAMTQALTLSQWEEHIGHINRTAQREYHRQILERSAQVREVFTQAGAISARQLPQDLLMRTPGDPGRHCYPLALLMGAAVVDSESAERALIGHVATANLNPDEVGARALLTAMDELRAVPANAVGQYRGRQDLDTVMQKLEAKTAPVVLLLDTGNHALLLAKVRVGKQAVYRFYDPNFAIYAFAASTPMKAGMQRYLSDGDNTLARLYGLGDVGTAQFNVTELNTAVIAERTLSSGLRVDSFLRNTSMSDPGAGSAWNRQAVARTRSLSENARMGASLAQLDGRYWAREFDQATQQLRTGHALRGDYLPLLDTLEKQPNGDYSLTLADARNPQDTLKVTTADPRFSKVRQHLQRLVQAVAGKEAGRGEADGGSRLSFAFAIQTLITEMRHREYQGKEGQVPALSIALQVQVYVSYTQLGFGVLNDAAQIINVVRQFAASERTLALRQASLAGRVLGRASTAVGFGFSAANIGFDIYGLAVAENQEQRSRLATQLVFDVAALGLDIAALAVGGTVGAAASILAVPLLGVGIGVSAIASNLGQISDKAKDVGAHLRKVQDAYGSGVYTRKDGVLSFKPEAVITELDLQGNRIGFDSQKFFPLRPRGGLELPQFDNDPKLLHLATDIRDALGLPQVVSLMRPAPADVQTVVLPCTPLCYYGYEYQVGTAGYAYQPQPGELEREPRQASETAGPGLVNIFSPFGALIHEFAGPAMETWYPSLRNSTVEKLEFGKDGKQRFYFFANSPFPHILYKLYPFNKPTQIVVTLDEQVRQLLVPALPNEWKQCISYEIFTRSPGTRQLWLTPGLVAVSLHNYAAAQWILHASWVSEAKVRFEETCLSVDGIRIEGRVDFIELAKGELFRVDRQTERLMLMSVTLDDSRAQAGTSGISVSIGEETSPVAVLARIRALAAEKRLASAHVPLHRFALPLNPAPQAVFVTAWYDVAQDRLLYARNLPEAVNDGLVLGAASAEHAWFYHPEHATVWRVDAITGTVNYRYRLMNPATGSRIIGCEQIADRLRVRQAMLEVESGVEVTFEYQLFKGTVALDSISTSAAWSDYTPRRSANYWRSLVDRFKTPRAYADKTPGMASSLASWGPHQFVRLRSHVQQTLRDLGWIRLADRMFFQLDHASGLQLDTVMLVWDDGPGDLPLLFSKQARLLLRGAAAGAAQIIASDVIDVSRFGMGYIVTREDGRLFEIDKQGVLKFVGIGPHWLRVNPDWQGALPALAKNYRDAPFTMIGLVDVSGRHAVAAWCIDEQVVLAEGGERKELALVGLTPDRQAVWLLDVFAGQLLRQPLIRIDALRQAFGNGNRLLSDQRLPVAQKVWSQWAFVEVVPHGQGLLGRTREGVNVQLLDQQPARIVGVEKQWLRRHGQTPGQLQSQLKALLDGQAHVPVLQVENTADHYRYYVPQRDRLFDVPGRDDGQWPLFLGTRDASEALLFDSIDGLIFSTGAAGPLHNRASHAQREDDILTLESRAEVTEVMALLPDGVDKLILAFGAQALSYRVSDEAWQRLDCIVLETRRPLGAEAPGMGTLVLGMVAAEHLLMSLDDGHLVLTDPDNAHSLIVRNVIPEEGEPGAPVQISVNLSGELYTLPIEQWLEALSQVRGSQGVATLQAVINQSL
ncbi:TcdA/TcdB pore-forming domain-containing protein [Pseudomonas sp. A34-9]|uniref:TcdA/TcdB pore-forming domain-containing protein n=1 Tax=Pseudomonas sp. A34-9 TaxID=3034675 RepID=UPI00240E197F|nr:TcdA/TcdB pore-forming domain-containing protein [Pseudomonas sp. A34-9]